MENTKENKRLFELYSAAALTGLTSSTPQGMPMSAIAAAYAIDMIQQYNEIFPAPVVSDVVERVPANIVDFKDIRTSTYASREEVLNDYGAPSLNYPHIRGNSHPYDDTHNFVPPASVVADEKKYGSATGHGGTEEQAPVVDLIKDLRIVAVCTTAEEREQVVDRAIACGLSRPYRAGDFWMYPLVLIEGGKVDTRAADFIERFSYANISATDFLKTYTK